LATPETAAMILPLFTSDCCILGYESALKVKLKELNWNHSLWSEGFQLQQ